MPFLILDSQFSLIDIQFYEPGIGCLLQTEKKKKACFQGIYSLVVEMELDRWSVDPLSSWRLNAGDSEVPGSSLSRKTPQKASTEADYHDGDSQHPCAMEICYYFWWVSKHILEF